MFELLFVRVLSAMLMPHIEHIEGVKIINSSHSKRTNSSLHNTTYCWMCLYTFSGVNMKKY